MFESVLVANRGEIAVRVMQACEELGIGTVAVYSDADQGAGHVRYADEAYNVGPARAADSYLDQEAIVDAAQRAGADAIHPGYGFLAENAEFAALVEDTDGLTWIGPTSDAMERLGEKTKARQIMQSADVPIVPGTTEPVEDPGEVTAFGEEHGYPIAIKAEGGGGGRGMKVVRSADEAADQLESAKREGEAYFDNDSVYLERYLENPKHIEVQIIADEHGNVRHLGERDCSLQRRHQKVIEEGPSPALTDDLRTKIGEAARRGVDEGDYTNAGTVEFLVEDGNYYFLEVNTRIQVEHTVTEEITGIDIVRRQIRVAQGEELSFTQDEVEIDGHAMEFRINAENPANDFTPTPGHLDTYDPPGGMGVRVDDAIRQDDDVSGDYDSMIAKLIVHAEDRRACLARSRRALAQFDIEGLHTVIPFHRLMLEDDHFVSGEHTTKYLDEQLDHARIEEAVERWGPKGLSDTTGEPSHDVSVEVDGRNLDVRVFGATQPQSPSGGGGGGSGGGSAGETAAPAGDGNRIAAEMQGTVLSVNVDEGDEVAAGDVLLVLEAMKMENDIVAETGGTVSTVAVGEGDSVDMNDTLVILE